MEHATAILVHAAAATVALITAVAAVRCTRLLGLHVVSMVVMTVTLAVALGVDRSQPLGLALVFWGLLVLAVAMTVRSVQAFRCRPDAGGLGSVRYVEHLGFAIIGLTTGFVAIAVLRLEWGVAPVVAAGVLVPVAGHVVVAGLIRRREDALAVQSRRNEDAESGHPAHRHDRDVVVEDGT